MHPEIHQKEPGSCSICGMALVPESTVKHVSKPIEDRGLGPITWKSYIPLIVIFALLIAATAVSAYVSGAVTLVSLVERFMAGFFIVFGGFKLLDLPGFAEGYSTYDLLAEKWRGYGFLYPFVELAFGFLMLAGIVSATLLSIELVVMLFSGAGVVRKLLKHEPVLCVCLGTTLKIPLTFVTLIEDFGMALLAALLLFL